jgi:co-chaperonin GroES (HSP10)
MPGRVILKFPPAAEKLSGGIIVAAPNYTRRAEIGEVYDVGIPIGEKETAAAALMPVGRKIPIRYGNGVMFWEKHDPPELQWMSDFRAYSILEVTSWIPDEFAPATTADALKALGLDNMPTRGELAELAKVVHE